MMMRLFAFVFLVLTSVPASATFIKHECEQVLRPQYSIFPLHRKLFEVRQTLGKELKLLDYTVLKDTSVRYVGINMKFPGKRLLLYFYYENNPAKIIVNANEIFAKADSKGENIVSFELDREGMSDEEHEYHDKLTALALSLVIPAAFPFEQNLIVELMGSGSVIDQNEIEEFLKDRQAIILPLVAFHAVGRLGFHKVIGQPDVSLQREISFTEKNNELSEYGYQFRVRMGFVREE